MAQAFKLYSMRLGCSGARCHLIDVMYTQQHRQSRWLNTCYITEPAQSDVVHKAGKGCGVASKNILPRVKGAIALGAS